MARAALAAPTNCDAHGGGIFVGSGEVPEGIVAVTSTPTTMGAVSLNKSTVDCNEAKAGDGGTPGGNGGEAFRAAASMPKALCGAARPVFQITLACGGDGAQGASVTAEDDSFTILTAISASPAAPAAKHKGAEFGP